jgi:hypothetical protein
MDEETLQMLFLRSTERAVLLGQDEDDNGTWLPLSQLTLDPPIQDLNIGDTVEVTAPTWLLEKEGLL